MASLTLTCSNCGKQFLLIDQEQVFLKQKQIPNPSNCPSCRQTRRLMLRGERALYKAKCQECGKDIIVSFNPDEAKSKILCKSDYEKYYEENDPILTDPLPEI